MKGGGGVRVTRMRCPNCSDIDSCYFEKWKRVACAFGSVFGGSPELHTDQPWLCLLGRLGAFSCLDWLPAVGRRLGGQQGWARAQRAPGTVQRGEKNRHYRDSLTPLMQCTASLTAVCIAHCSITTLSGGPFLQACRRSRCVHWKGKTIRCLRFVLLLFMLCLHEGKEKVRHVCA